MKLKTLLAIDFGLIRAREHILEIEDAGWKQAAADISLRGLGCWSRAHFRAKGHSWSPRRTTTPHALCMYGMMSRRGIPVDEPSAR